MTVCCTYATLSFWSWKRTNGEFKTRRTDEAIVKMGLGPDSKYSKYGVSLSFRHPLSGADMHILVRIDVINRASKSSPPTCHL